MRPAVGIPVKNRLDLTRQLVVQLTGQTDGPIYIVDNGSTDGTAEWVDQHPALTRIAAPAVGIHRMWNLVVDAADNADVILLNNDVTIGPDFIPRLTEACSASEHVAVCGNYDGRTADGPTVQLRGICGGRYDGTGGFAGFAFAVRRSWFDSGYRFPEEQKWWCGDHDLVLSIEETGGTVGMALDAHCSHEGAATAGNWARLSSQIETDIQRFRKKWARR